MSLQLSIQKQLGDFHLQVDLDVPTGIVGLLGQSGSGKSVTLQCIAGILAPDTGRIVLDGHVLFDSAQGINLPPQQRNVGYLFQHYALFPHWTVEKNLSVIDKGNTFTMLEKLGLQQVKGLLPHQLSGGQKQRLAMGRMLLTQPKVVLLDEPLSALDDHLSWEMETYLYDTLQALDCPVVWVSHHAPEVRRNCQSICVLAGGTAQPLQETGLLFNHPTTLAAAKLAGFENVLPQSPWSDTPVAIRGKNLAQVPPDSPGAQQVTVMRRYQDVDGDWSVLQLGDLQLRMASAVPENTTTLWVAPTEIQVLS